MRRLRLVGSLFTALAAAIPFTAFVPELVQAQPSPGAVGAAFSPGSIDGTILPPTGLSGKSTAGLTVTIVETSQTTTTDKLGHYSFLKVTPGTYTLLVTGDGFSRLRITDVVVAPGHELTISAQAMAYVVKNGEVQMMDEVVVHANKDVEVMAEYVVEGTAQKPFVNTGNIDLPRTIDDPQPYYMWNAADIEKSGATTVADFFERMVPMNTQKGDIAAASFGGSSAGGNVANINLGGFGVFGTSPSPSSGTQNTLLLVDGHPLPKIGFGASRYLPDVNGIPVLAIDHIEVLTGSASAIYGASAAGGAVNIVLKHEYTGTQLAYSYNNTFSSDAPTKAVSLSVGAGLEGGKTHLLLTANYQTTNPLAFQDRSQIWGPYSARYFAGYPGGELAVLNVAGGNVPLTGYPTATLDRPIVSTTSGLAPLVPGNSSYFVQIPAGYQGFQTSGSSPLTANFGQVDLALPNLAYYGTALPGALTPLASLSLQKSVRALLRRQMTPWLELYAEFENDSNAASYTDSSAYLISVTVPATVPGNPFGEALRVNGIQATGYSLRRDDNESRSLSVGAKLSLPRGWNADLDYTWGASASSYLYTSVDSSLLQSDVTAGTVNVIRDLSAYPISFAPYAIPSAISNTSSTDDVQFKAAGPLLQLWAGAPTLAANLEHHKEGAGAATTTASYPAGDPTTLATLSYVPGQSDSTDSAYAELNIPLVARMNHVPLVSQLDLQLSGRSDSYTELGTAPGTASFTYKVGGAVTTSPNLSNGQIKPYTTAATKYKSRNGLVGFLYRPAPDIAVRGSYSTGFVPPTYAQLQPPISSGTVTQTTGAYPGVPTTAPWSYSSITDPRLGATYTVPVITGGHVGLQPEISRAVDWGIIVEPSFVKGLRISADYSKVTKYDDIITPSAALIIANEAQFSSRVTRGAPNAGQSVGPVVLIDATAINAPQSYSSSINLAVDYTWRTRAAGTWRLSGVANSWQHYVIQSTIGGAFVEQLANPYVASFGSGASLAKFKGNVGLDWTQGPFSAGWLARYTGPYTPGAQYGTGGRLGYSFLPVNGWISGQVYHDIYIGYKIGTAAAGAPWWRTALANTSVRLGIKNVLNHIPPFDPTGPDFLWMSPYGDTLLRNYQLRFEKNW